MNYTIYLSSICFILVVGLVYSILLINQYKQKYDHQSSKLIQTYLNKEFITRVLNIIMNDSTSHSDKILIIMAKIKEYFDLDEIILYNQNSHTEINYSGTFVSNIIRDYIEQNIRSISDSLKNKCIDIRTMNNENTNFSLYIIPIEDNSKVTFVVFAQSNKGGSLNSGDLETLSNPIRIILSAIFSKKIAI